MEPSASQPEKAVGATRYPPTPASSLCPGYRWGHKATLKLGFLPAVVMRGWFEGAWEWEVLRRN